VRLVPGEGTTCPSARAAVAASAAALCCGATPPGLVLNASVVGICDCWPPDEAGVAAIAHVRAGPSVGSGGLVPRASCMVWGIAGGGAVGSARRIHQEQFLFTSQQIRLCSIPARGDAPRIRVALETLQRRVWILIGGFLWPAPHACLPSCRVAGPRSVSCVASVQ
jgi:hypothetical protein